MVKSFEVSDSPARCAKFIARKNWFIVGTDDNCLRVFNYNTSERVAVIDAHYDYIRAISVHPTKPLVLSASDDMSIKMWDWEQGWKNIQTFEGHSHYVMAVAFNPKDSNTFASASLDMTIKVWNIASPNSNCTLKGHEKGVNAIDFYPGPDKPYLVSGADDSLVKVWDYQSKTCIATLEGHAQNITAVIFHPDMPLIVSGGEDGTLRFWHSNTWRFESSYSYGFDRIWSIASHKGMNQVAIGFDEGTICIQIGKEEPSISMDANGKVIWAKHNEILSTNIKAAPDATIATDGEKVCYAVKEMGHCEIFPQLLQHSPNGRFVVVCGDGEYIIYTSLAWRNKSFGKALDFAWGVNSNEYAVRESSGNVAIWKNFEESFRFRPITTSDALFGGKLLGVKSGPVVCFYDWETFALVRRIDVNATGVYWNDEGDLVVISSKEGTFVLNYSEEVLSSFLSTNSPQDIPFEGLESAFVVGAEISDSIISGRWIGKAFAYSSTNRLCYWIGGQIFTISHLDCPMFIVGYSSKDSRIYLVDKEVEFYSFTLSARVLEYQTAIIDGDFDRAESLLVDIPTDHLSKIAIFLESAGLPDKAFSISSDLEHKFELALSMNRVDLAKEVVQSFHSSDPRDPVVQGKWKQLGDLALKSFKFLTAEECYWNGLDFSSLLLIYSASSDLISLQRLAQAALQDFQYNIAFSAAFLAKNHPLCQEILLKSKKYSEAALFSSTYGLGMQSSVDHWNDSLIKEKHPLANCISTTSSNGNEEMLSLHETTESLLNID